MRRLVRAAAIACLLTPMAAREAFGSPGSFAYVAAPTCDAQLICALNLYVYDATTSALVTTIPITTARSASSPGLAISLDGSRVYVAVSIDVGQSVIAVDGTRHQVIGPVGLAPAGKLAVSRDGHILFIASDGIYLYDTATHQQITKIPPESDEFVPSGVTADPVRDRVYWTSPLSCGGRVHAYDTTLGSEVTLPAALQHSAYFWIDAFASRDGTRLYVTAPVPVCTTNQPGAVQILDLATLADPRRGPSPLFPKGAVDAPSSHLLYVWDRDTGSFGTAGAIYAFDRDTFATIAQVAVAGVLSVAVNADESRAYVATAPVSSAPSAPDSLSVLDLASNAVSSVIPLPGPPSNAVTTPPAPAATVCSYRLDTHQSSWSVNGGSAPVAVTTNCAWVASSSAPWAHVALHSGTGSATLTISVDSNFTATNRSATVTIGGQVVTVTQASFSSTAPFGTIDTPADNATGLSGAIAVTGWALDDVGVMFVRIFRDSVPGETPGQQVFIGNATFVDGARPDVQAVYPSLPNASRAGWGLQVLTNMLPNGGTGTFRLYAFADDVDGHTTLLGFRTINTDNQAAAVPFGTIDTPGQGVTVSGVVVNFGWALSRNPIAPDGSTIDVIVDGVVVGHPVYGNFRADIASLFPGFPNSTGAVGYFILDTTTLTNGVHTIAWVVRDSTGAVQGIGSRFFTVWN